MMTEFIYISSVLPKMFYLTNICSIALILLLIVSFLLLNLVNTLYDLKEIGQFKNQSYNGIVKINFMIVQKANIFILSPLFHNVIKNVADELPK